MQSHVLLLTKEPSKQGGGRTHRGKGEEVTTYIYMSTTVKLKNGNYGEASVYLAPSKTGK